MRLSKGKFPTDKRVRRAVATLIVAVAVSLIAYSAWGLWQRYQATHNPDPTISTSVVTHSTDTPDETPLTDACTAYTVADKYPERINLPGIEASGCIEQVGIDQHGAIAVPTSIYTAGWYTESALPGQPGLSIIDGHISGRYNENGIFQHLQKLKAGDRFTVTLGSGVVLDYQVFKVQSVPLDQAAEVLFRKELDGSQLNLITCGGKYNKDTKLYDHRVIVSAELVSE